MAARAMATPCRLMLILLAAVAAAASHPAHEVRFVSSLLFLVSFLSLPDWILGVRVKFCAAAGGGAAGSCGGGDGTRILIKGGTVVNAHRAEEADVYIEDGVVVAVRPNIPVSGRCAFAGDGLGALSPRGLESWDRGGFDSDVLLLGQGATLLSTHVAMFYVAKWHFTTWDS